MMVAKKSTAEVESKEPENMSAEQKRQECWERDHDLTPLLMEVFVSGSRGIPPPGWVTKACGDLAHGVLRGIIHDWGIEFPKPNGKKNSQRIVSEARYEHLAMYVYSMLMRGRWGKYMEKRKFTDETARAVISGVFADDGNHAVCPDAYGYIDSFIKSKGWKRSVSLCASTVRDWVKNNRDALGKDWMNARFPISTGLKQLPNLIRVEASPISNPKAPLRVGVKKKAHKL